MTTSGRAAADTPSVKSAERVLTLLETIGVTAEGATFTELHARLGIPKSSLFALLEVMSARDYVELDATSRRYSLGIRVWETGLAYQRHHSVLAIAREVMESIVQCVNETVQFAKLAGSDNVYLAKVDSTHALRLQSDVGARLPAHATGIGKALLAQLDDGDVRRRFSTEKLPVYTPNTIATVPTLLDELAAIRRRGFAIDNEEYTAGVFCLAVPVADEVAFGSYALSVSVPTLRATLGALTRMLTAIAEGSDRISARIGHRVLPEPLRMLTSPDIAAARINELLASKRYKLRVPA